MKLIERAWQSYRVNVVPHDAGEVQLKETRNAFYAGAAILFTTLTSETFLDDDGGGSIDPTIDDLLKMEMIQEEIDEFGA
ncbi:MAG: hypothetical protein E4H01_16075, partial [Lysobacterales bacterium]